MTFLPRTRLVREMRSLARWHASEACPRGTSRAGAPSIFSSADATCQVHHSPTESARQLLALLGRTSGPA